MDKLWSPWRSKYIDSFKEESKTGCIFCDAKDQDINDDSTLLVHKGKFSFVVLNLYPYNGGHLMIVPYRHLDNFIDLSEEELTEIMNLTKNALKALEMESKPQGFNFGANLGRAAGAGIDTHLHFHIVPRWIGDSNFMPVIGEIKVISQDLLDMKNKLVKQFEKLLL
jgi:ATP adenylyltransferase